MSDCHPEYQGPPLTDRELAEIMLHAHLRGRSIGDPAVHEEVRKGLSGGAYPATENHPCLSWQARRDGIEYCVAHDGVKRILKWSTLEQLDSGQLDIFGELQ